MTENLSPNKKSDRIVKMSFNQNERHLINLKQSDSQLSPSKAKKCKIDINIENNECMECVEENDLINDLMTKLNQTTNPSTDCEIVNDSQPLTSDKNTESKAKTELEIELELIRDCETSNPKVVALQTMNQLENQCKAIGLTFNSDYKKQTLNQTSVKRSKSDTKFEVECIYDSGVEEETNKIVYLVKWRNWSEEHNTWEPLSHLHNCRDLVDQYKYIKKTNNQNLMQTYRDFYRLKAIIEDICEKKVDQNTVITLLLIFNKISLRDFNYTKVLIRKMMSEFKDNLKIIDDVLNVKNTEKKIKRMETVFNKLVGKLSILNRFETIGQFFEFFGNRKLVQQRLNKWENDINQIIERENEGQKIKLENYVDTEVPPQNFDYIGKCKTNNPNITLSDDPPLYCQCTNCDQQQSDCCVSTYQMPIVYNKNGILKDVRNARHAIYECNKKCECGPDCVNRVIQKGRKHKLAIFRTDDGRGWGVRALEPIPKGSFVMEYVGEIITIEEADSRGAKYDAEGRTYLFDLDYTPDEETDVHKYAVDATQCGNVSHFVNHSCDPNLDTRVAWINNLDPFMPHIALFAVRNIKLNEELTFDYKINVHGITDKSDSDDAITNISEKNRTNSLVSVEMNDNPLKTPIDSYEYSENGDISDDSGISQMTNDKSFSATQKPHPAMESKSSVKTCASEKRLTRVTCKCGAKTCRKYLY